MESGTSSDADSDVASDALARRQATDAMHVRTASAMLQSDAQLHLPTASQAGTQTHKGQLALKPSVAGQTFHKGETGTSVTDLRGQLKPKVRKKNRLGQRARQQLGRAKEAQAVESRPRNTFKVGHAPLMPLGCAQTYFAKPLPVPQAHSGKQEPALLAASTASHQQSRSRVRTMESTLL